MNGSTTHGLLMAKKWTMASDDKYDKKHGIKEGSPQDKKLDAKRGLKDSLAKLGGK